MCAEYWSTRVFCQYLHLHTIFNALSYSGGAAVQFFKAELNNWKQPCLNYRLSIILKTLKTYPDTQTGAQIPLRTRTWWCTASKGGFHVKILMHLSKGKTSVRHWGRNVLNEVCLCRNNSPSYHRAHLPCLSLLSLLLVWRSKKRPPKLFASHSWNRGLEPPTEGNRNSPLHRNLKTTVEDTTLSETQRSAYYCTLALTVRCQRFESLATIHLTHPRQSLGASRTCKWYGSQGIFYSTAETTIYHLLLIALRLRSSYGV